MRKSNINWWTIKSSQNEIKNLSSVISSKYYNEGEFTAKFESKIGEILDVKHVVTTTSGTTALYAALKSMGIGFGDSVIVPNLTFIATANAVRMTGAKVKLVDVNKLDMTISLNEIEKNYDKTTKAIIPVHISGRSALSEELMKFSNSHGIKVLEDAAEAFGSRAPSFRKYLGTIGLAGILSFSPNKIVTSGQGGAVLTNNDDLAFALKTLKDQGRPIRGTGGADIHSFEGTNLKFTNLQAAIGLSQLEEFYARQSHLTEVTNYYSQNFQECEHQWMLPFRTELGEFALWPEFYSKNIESVKIKLNSRKIGFRELWLPISQQESYKNDNSYPNSIDLSKHCIWLPSSFDLVKADLDFVLDSLICEVCLK